MHRKDLNYTLLYLQYCPSRPDCDAGYSATLNMYAAVEVIRVHLCTFAAVRAVGKTTSGTNIVKAAVGCPGT